MALIEITCPECGAKVKINEQATGELTCPFCGSKYLAEDVLKKLTEPEFKINNEIKVNLIDFEIEENTLKKYIGNGEEVTIPDSVIKIGFKAFANCNSVKVVNIPNCVQSIDIYGFFECKNLETVNIEKGLADIKMFAFMGCKKLKNINIPSTVNEIGNSAFYGCPNLTNESKKEIREIKGGRASIEVLQGCYIATCVYGSYDCENVWVLRRYRDDVLSKNIFGRLFIKVYYFLSPKLIRFFGGAVWFNKFWTRKLDKKVNKLSTRGIKNTPYEDKTR